MKKRPVYPLEQVTTIKQKKLEESQRVLRERKAALEQEEKKLRTVEEERDKVKEHRLEKLTQLRAKMDEGIAPYKIQQMRSYLKTVDEKLHIAENKVREQKKRVDEAAAQVEIARKDMIQKQQDVEKMHLHRKEWEKEMQLAEDQEEAVETDEIGSIIHHRQKRQSHPSSKKKPSE